MQVSPVQVSTVPQTTVLPVDARVAVSQKELAAERQAVRAEQERLQAAMVQTAKFEQELEATARLVQEDRTWVEREFARLDEATRQPLANQQLRELWATAATGGKTPHARYLHASAVVLLPVREDGEGKTEAAAAAAAWGGEDYGLAELATHMVVVGGRGGAGGGRALKDVQLLHVDSLRWLQPPPLARADAPKGTPEALTVFPAFQGAATEKAKTVTMRVTV